MRIDAYFGRGCGHQDATRALIDEALEEAGATGAEVTVALVDSPVSELMFVTTARTLTRRARLRTARSLCAITPLKTLVSPPRNR